MKYVEGINEMSMANNHNEENLNTRELMIHRSIYAYILCLSRIEGFLLFFS